MTCQNELTYTLRGHLTLLNTPRYLLRSYIVWYNRYINVIKITMKQLYVTVLEKNLAIKRKHTDHAK